MCVMMHADPHCVAAGESDRPPVANGGQDQVVQPQDNVILNGIDSKDDQKIASFQWQMLTGYPFAVIEVSEETAGQAHFRGVPLGP